VADYLALAMRDAGRIELRHQDSDRWRSLGLFDDLFALRQAVDRLAASGKVYTSLNAPSPNCSATKALCDADIASVVRLPFDFDPVRQNGIKESPSTDAELAAASTARDHFVAAMAALGWPPPAMGMSGNGAHALYRCRLAASDVTALALRAMYRGMREEFSTGEVLFDASVHNFSRIWRCYGTLNRKGEATAERPHRVATVDIPARWDAVSPRQVAALAALYRDRDFRRIRSSAPPRRGATNGHGNYSTLDVVVWFAAHGVYKRQLASGKHAVTCPWVGEHSTTDEPCGTDTVIWEADPPQVWPQFHCSHAHCEGRTIRDVMALWADVDDHCATPWERL
jgi:hypothetical protein